MTWPTTRWPTAQELLERMRELANDPLFTASCTATDLPSTTHFSRTTNFVRVGGGAIGGSHRAVVLFVGGIHAREWSPSTALANLVQKLLAAKVGGTSIVIGTDTTSPADITAIFNNIDLFVAPMINPDGYEHSFGRIDTGGGAAALPTRDWRKNLRPAPATLPPGCTAANAIGVDINRNFDVLWKAEDFYLTTGAVSSSTNPCNEAFRGATAAFSEPEARNVRFLLEKEPRYFVDCHMFGRAIFHSWGVEDNQPIVGPTPALDPRDIRDGAGAAGYREPINATFLTEVTDLANLMADGTNRATSNRYTPQHGALSGAIAGAADDFAFARNLGTSREHCRSFTLEAGSTFIPVFATHFADDEAEIQAALLTLLRHVAGLSQFQAPAPPTPPTTATPSDQSCKCTAVGDDSTPGVDSLSAVALLFTIVVAATAGGLIGAAALGMQWLMEHGV